MHAAPAASHGSQRVPRMRPQHFYLSTPPGVVDSVRERYLKKLYFGMAADASCTNILEVCVRVCVGGRRAPRIRPQGAGLRTGLHACMAAHGRQLHACGRHAALGHAPAVAASHASPQRPPPPPPRRRSLCSRSCTAATTPPRCAWTHTAPAACRAAPSTPAPRAASPARAAR